MFEKDFSKKIIKSLYKKGITIIGVQNIPDPEYGYFDPIIGYVLNDNGTQKIRTYFQVIEISGE